MNKLVFSVANFCVQQAISRAKFYQLLAEGLAPKSFLVGRRRLITQEAARDWRVSMEARSAGDQPSSARVGGSEK